MSCLPSHSSYSNTLLSKDEEEEKKEGDKEDQTSFESSTTLSNYVLIAAKDSKSGRYVTLTKSEINIVYGLNAQLW